MKFPCPQCDHDVEACRSFAGFSVRCPACRQPVMVPQVSSPTFPGIGPISPPKSESSRTTAEPVGSPRPERK